MLARTYSVEEWVLPALTALCSRALPLSLDEARQMDLEDVILVASVREEIRDGALRVDVTDIPHCVEAVQVGKLDRLTGYRAKAEAKAKAIHEFEAKAQVEAEVKKKREANAIAKDDGAKAEADAWETRAEKAKTDKAEAEAASSVPLGWGSGGPGRGGFGTLGDKADAKAATSVSLGWGLGSNTLGNKVKAKVASSVPPWGSGSPGSGGFRTLSASGLSDHTRGGVKPSS